jgi:hypothetical protein
MRVALSTPGGLNEAEKKAKWNAWAHKVCMGERERERERLCCVCVHCCIQLSIDQSLLFFFNFFLTLNYYYYYYYYCYYFHFETYIFLSKCTFYIFHHHHHHHWLIVYYYKLVEKSLPCRVKEVAHSFEGGRCNPQRSFVVGFRLRVTKPLGRSEK